MEKETSIKNTFLSFNVGKETFAVSVKKVLEVLEKQYITEVPNVSNFIRGVINFRGKIIPIIESRAKFNLQERAEGEKYVVIVFDIIVENKKMLIGALADNVNDVFSIESEDILKVPDMGFNYNTDFLIGMLKNQERFTMILDIDKVFSTEDIHILEEIENP